MQRAFSLVEVLAAIAIIGIITFLAIPNIVRIKEDGERHLAIARAEALNMAVASYIQAQGMATATNAWAGKNEAERYTTLASYLAYAPAAMTNYMPGGYTAVLTNTLDPLTKVGLNGPVGATNGDIPY